MLKGFIIGVFATWFIVGVLLYVEQEYFHGNEIIWNFLAMPFYLVGLPIVFVWVFTTNKKYREDFIKNIKRKIKKLLTND